MPVPIVILEWGARCIRIATQKEMSSRFHVAVIVLVGLLFPPGLVAQSGTGDESLGDLARSLRKSKAPPTRKVVDNDNLLQIMDEAQSQRLARGLLFSSPSAGRSFEVSSPDGTCSLSFNAEGASPLSDAVAPQDLPGGEVAKLDGPAVINGDTLEISVYNGSEWSLNEITVGLTIVHSAADLGGSFSAQLIPASVVIAAPGERRSDLTMLYHLQGSAAPFTTTVFRQTLSVPPGPEQDWHWAIVQARGVPPATLQPGQ